jgi:uridylate kinase
MGMLGTVINALALGNTLKQLDVECRVMTSMSIPSVAEPYLQNKALAHLEKGRVLIFGGGTGNPFFSTDTTASLRAAEINADLILMAKNGIDGVYDKDPSKYKDAVKIHSLRYADLINQKLEVIDLTSAAMCDENNIDMVIFDMNVKGNILRAANNEPIGTTLTK